jgi:1-acyl-sn-glycerol-3-phosphate acyltransferase
VQIARAQTERLVDARDVELRVVAPRAESPEDRRSMSLLRTLQAISTTATITLPTVADGLLRRVTAEKSDERLDWWAKKLLDDAGVELEVRGADNVPEGEALVLMSNHRSYYDIPTVFRAVPGRIRMVAKKELFAVPLWGRAMHEAGFICVDRGKRESAIESLKESGELLKSGTRVWIAPEGTRSKTGALGPFKSGGFHLALDAGVRILPIAIEGTESVLPADSLSVHRGAKVRATILPLIDAPAYGKDRRKELTADVRAAIAEALGVSSE